MADEYLTPQRMLAELDFPAGESDRRAILDAFGDALDPVFSLVYGSTGSHGVAHPLQAFCITHLLIRGLSDLTAGAHLASHYYLPQAYSVMRPVLDSVDLIELFAQDPAQADLWCSTTKAHVDFAPSRVRTLIGNDSYDPVHGHFSESGSHPRFAGAQISGAMRQREDGSERTAMLRLGPMFDWHPSTLIVWLFAFDALVKLGFKMRHLETATAGQTARAAWLAAYANTMDHVVRGCELVLAALRDHEEPESDPTEHYKRLRDQLREWIADEPATA